MTEVRESPSGPLVSVSGDNFVAGTILFPNLTTINANTSQEETFEIGPNPDSTAAAQQWSVIASQVPSNDGITNLLDNALVFDPPAVVLGEDAIFRVRLSIKNPTAAPVTLDGDFLFFVVAAQKT